MFEGSTKIETQKIRVKRLEEMMGTTLESQTATLRVLRDISKRVEENSALLDEHSKILKQHSIILMEHTAILKEHSAILKEHSTRLANLEQLMSRVLEELVAIKEILVSSRGMGFVPESDDKD